MSGPFIPELQWPGEMYCQWDSPLRLLPAVRQEANADTPTQGNTPTQVYPKLGITLWFHFHFLKGVCPLFYWPSLIDKLAKCCAVLGKTSFMLDPKSLHILFRLLILPYLSNCVEVWGNMCKGTLQPICTRQRRAIRTTNRAGYREHTNPLFIKSYTLKCMDLVKFKTAQIMYEARNDLLPKKTSGECRKEEKDDTI